MRITVTSKKLSYAFLVVVVLILPLVVKSDYYLHLLILCAINVILASSLRAITTVGQVSLGHAGFMGIGAYTSAILCAKCGLSSYAAFLAGGLAAMIVAALIAYPVMRVRTVYFAMLTMFLGQVVTLVITQWRDLTGGTSGFINIARFGKIPIPGHVSIDFTSKVANLYFVLILMLLILLFLYAIDQSYIGKTFKAVAQDDSLAASAGINVARYRALIFCIGCFFAGLAGSFYAHYMCVITPDSFNILYSMYLLIYLVVGGPKKFGGAIVGPFVLTLVPELSRVLKEYQPFLFVGVLYLVVFFVPGGLASLLERVSLRVRNVSLREIKPSA